MVWYFIYLIFLLRSLQFTFKHAKCHTFLSFTQFALSYSFFTIYLSTCEELIIWLVFTYCIYVLVGIVTTTFSPIKNCCLRNFSNTWSKSFRCFIRCRGKRIMRSDYWFRSYYFRFILFLLHDLRNQIFECMFIRNHICGQVMICTEWWMNCCWLWHTILHWVNTKSTLSLSLLFFRRILVSYCLRLILQRRTIVLC